MWFLTRSECEAWTNGRGFPTPIADLLFAPNAGSQVSLPLRDLSFARLTWLSQFLADTLVGSDETLLWVTTWGIWPGSENLHLFYRLRESYGERRKLFDAPGHCFAKHESADLATFIQLALTSGWDFHVLPTPTYLTGFGSHDEFFDFRSDRPDGCDEIRTTLTQANLKFT